MDEKLRYIFHPVWIMFLLMSMLSCTCEPEDEKEEVSGKLRINFYHTIDGIPVEFNTLKYTNEAGNQYLVSDFKYFVSDVRLYRNDGYIMTIDDWKDIHYIDNTDTNTFHWSVFDPIPPGNYDSLSFIFGLNEEKNQNGLFVNPPEVNMFWPDALGGGYHYLMLDGKWLDNSNQESPFNFHTGIGREITPTDTLFHQLFFRVSLPSSDFEIQQNTTSEISLCMNIESWFKTPHAWNWNLIGGGIMENYQAMRMATDNGHDVFTVLPH